MATRRITKKDLSSGAAFFRASFGDTPKNVLLRDQRSGLAENVQQYERYMDEETYATVGTMRDKLSKQDKSSLIATKMSFAGFAIFRAKPGSDIDFQKLLFQLHMDLMAATPVMTGRMRRGLRYSVGGNLARTMPAAGSWTIAGVANVVPYAAAMENLSPKPFRKVFNLWNRRARGKFDLRWQYLASSASEGGKAPVPIIEIGPLNSMNGATGRQFIKGISRNARRKKRIRREQRNRRT